MLLVFLGEGAKGVAVNYLAIHRLSFFKTFEFKEGDYPVERASKTR